MATNKQIINTRFANKSDTSTNWNIASTATKPFIPLKGEILFYTDLNKIKIGDGVHTPNQLEFISDIDSSKYMLKSTYDTDGDGVVDNAEKLGGVAASEYAKKTDVPTVPTNVGAFTNDAGYLTSYTETDPTVPSHVKGITTGDITNWNTKATTNYVDTKVAGIVDTAPEALNTLNELAAALGDDPNFATTVMTEIGKKVDKTTTVNGHALSGDVTITSVNHATSADSATAATTATSAIQDNQGRNIVNTYATKTELNGKAQRISLTGQCQLTDSRLSVIALCYAPTTTSTNNSSYTVGRISVARTNNLDTPKFADIEMGAAHGGIGRVRTRYTRTGFDVFEPCTFEYNGVLYGGVKFNPAVSSFTLVEFTGVTTFPIFALDVYRLDTETVLNEEVYNSLSSSTVIVSHDLYLGDDAFITGANIASQSVAFATKATQDASGNTITSTYATKTELTNGLAGKAASSHTHTKSQITDFPTSMPASDVYSWAKASSKPSYSWSEITSKPSTFTPASHTQAASTITGLATVATSGKYSDLSGRPTIPAAANNGTLTIQKNGSTVATFGANQSTAATANIIVPTKTSELTNDSGFKNISYGTTLPSTGVNGQIFLLQG